MNDTIARIADAIFQARTDLRQVAPLAQSFGEISADDAYRAQDLNTERWLAGGRRVVGKKIGLTSKAVQAQLGVNSPDYGMLWSDTAFDDGDVVPVGRFMQPKVEVEIAFVLKRNLNTPDCSIAELIGAIDFAVPAIEIVDSAIADWKITLADTIADNASGGGFVLGNSPRSVSDLDLRLCGALLTCNGVVVSSGLGAACLGNPLNAALWLVRRMAELGRPLQAGEIVLSGALGPMHAATAGNTYTAEINGFAPLHLAFGA